MPDLRSLTLLELLDAVAAKQPTPGGGAVASATGALAAALAQMVVNYSVGKKNLAAHQSDLAEAVVVLERARAVLLQLADEDAAAYGAVNELSRLPESDPRRAALPEAQAACVGVPLATAAACVDLLRLFKALAPKTNRHLRSDLAIAAVLAQAAARSSRWNVLVNAEAAPNRDAVLGEAASLVNAAERLCADVEAACGTSP